LILVLLFVWNAAVCRNGRKKLPAAIEADALRTLTRRIDVALGELVQAVVEAGPE
jgi:hypothetical protein